MIILKDKVGSDYLRDVIKNDIQRMLSDINFKPNILVNVRTGRITDSCFLLIRSNTLLYKIMINYAAIQEYYELCVTAEDKKTLKLVHEDIEHGIAIRSVVLGTLTAILQESDIVSIPVYDSKGELMKESPFYNTFASLHNFMTSSILNSIQKKWKGEAKITTAHFNPYIKGIDNTPIKDNKVKEIMGGEKPFMEFLVYFNKIIDAEIGK